MTRAKDISKIVTDADLSGTLDVTGDLTVDTNTLHVDSTNNNVGIGTTSPSSMLFNDLVIGSGSGSKGITLFSGTLSDGTLAFGDSTSGTERYRGYVQYGHADDRLTFGTAATERMRIDSSGNVGIGTSSPIAPLHVKGTTNGNLYVRAASLAENTLTGTALSSVNDAASATVPLALEGSEFNFVQSNAVKVKVDTSGNVGIGTTTPNTTNLNSGTTSGIVVQSGGVAKNNFVALPSTGGGQWDVREGGSGGEFTMRMFDTSGTHNVQINSNGNHFFNGGNVGIGTSSPEKQLTLSSTDFSPLLIKHTDGGGAFVAFMDSSTTDSSEVLAGAVGNAFSIHAGDTERMRIDSSGNVGIGNSSPLGILSTLSNDNGLVFQTSSSSNKRVQMFFKDNGGTNTARIGNDISAGNTSQLQFIAGSGSTPQVTLSSSGDFFVPRVYVNTTGGSANVLVASNGQFLRSTSSQRYKNTINDATHGLTELLTLRPVTYKGNNDGDTVFGGLIAEEVHDAGLIEFVDYDEENRPDALRYSNMVSLCIKAIQELKAELDSAKARITALENGE